MPTKVPETGKFSPKEIENLTGYNFFSNFTHNEISLLLLCAEQVCYERGEVIFKEGDPGEELYVIVNGKVRITREYALGGDETLAILEDGQAFGEMAVIGDDVVRSAAARAAEKSVLLVLKRKPFRQLLHKDRDLAYTVLWNVLKQISGRLRTTNEKVMMFLTSAGLY